MDNDVLTDYGSLISTIKGNYNEEWFDANTKVHFKLKLNLREYFIISNLLFPAFLEMEND